MRALRHLLNKAVVGALALTLLFAPTGVMAATGGVGGRPANPDPKNPRTQSIFIMNIDRGQTKTDTILVSNNSDVAKTVELYAVDGIVTNTGAYTCSQAVEAKQDMGAYTTISKSTVTLDANKSEEVPFTVAMPETADVGEHNGCIVFQEAGDEGEATGNVRIRTRQAIRVVATVPGELRREVTIAGYSVASESNKQLFKLDIKNVGNVSADIDAKVQLLSLLGTVVYENGGGYPVLPNKDLNLVFENTKKPMFGGWYYTTAKVSYDKRAGSFSTLDASNLETKEAKRNLIFVPPTTTGVIALVAIAAIVATVMILLLSRRREKYTARTSWPTHTVTSGETLQSIAVASNISWKKLASVNNLKAPYALGTGDTLKVPPKSKNTPKTNSTKTSK